MLKPSLPDLLKSSLRSILKNKTRTFLTSLGIIIGVSSVILLISIGNGLKSFVAGQFESLGANLIFISPGKIFNRRGGINHEGAYTTVTFSDKDLTTLERKLPKDKIRFVFPMNQIPTTIKYQQEEIETYFLSTTVDFAHSRNQYPSQGNGRWFTDQEDRKRSRVVVLGHQITQELFSDSAGALGKKIIIHSKTFKVVGVLDKQGGGFGGPGFDDYVYLPLNTGQALVGNNKLQSIQIAVKNKDDIESIEKQTKQIMLKSYNQDEFSVFNQSQVLSSINTILGSLTAALSGIAAISLVVGGIGIANIMLVTVAERTHEIGLRKAVGAYPRAILLQFLFEAVILSCLGGAIGILLGSVGATIISRFFPAKVTLSSILLAFGVSSLVGVIFGVAPARKASQLSPISALRYE